MSDFDYKQRESTPEWDNYGPYWHVDHVKPASKFKYSSHNDIEFKKCWALSNLQPLTKRENMVKGDRYAST